MTKTITGLLNHHNFDHDTFSALRADRVITADVNVARHSQLNSSNTYWLGCTMHSALRRFEDAAPLSNNERMVWPYLSTIRLHLERLGVSRIRVEKPLDAWAGLPHGTCDLYLSGGMARHGVVDLKVVDALPGTPRAKDLAQVGGYLCLAARSEHFRQWWGGVVYASVRQRMIRFYLFRHPRVLIFSASESLKAA